MDYKAIIMRCAPVVLWGVVLVSSLASCATRQQLKRVNANNYGIGVYMADDTTSPVPLYDSLAEELPQDWIAVTDLYGKVLLMDAVKDEESGEMLATDRLKAVVVEAKFRNIPERNGYVNIAFEVTVPQGMQSSDWQVRLAPRLYYLGDTLNLDKIYITGQNYRAAQLRGYELYNRFLNSIIPPDCDYIDTYTYKRLLEIFIGRNFKGLAALKRDSTIVDSLAVANLFGVTQKEAIEHYTKQFLVKRNNRRLDNKDKMYSKYIKSPIEESGIRLDSVIASPNGTIRYHYVQSIKTRRNLRSVDMVMDGVICKEDKIIHTIPETDPLTYYISSMTFFADKSTRYIKKIVERDAVANTAAYIDFKTGDYRLCDTLHDNLNELKRIKNNVRELLENKDYTIDSLIITASCSPDGSYKSNIILAQKRAASIRRYFTDYIKLYTDSLASRYWDIDITDNGGMHDGNGKGDLSGRDEKENGKEDLSGRDEKENKKVDLSGSVKEINDNLLGREKEGEFGKERENSDEFFSKMIKTKSIAEHWAKLENLMRLDSNITDYESIERALLIEDMDAKERALAKTADFPYIRRVLYPLLRMVKFDFYLHRKGMIKDTVHTTEVDTLYMQGVEALLDRDYQRAVTLLRGYNDLNSAVAFICMDYNNSALAVLENLPKTARRDYMLAVVNSRMGKEEQAVEYFLHAVEQDASMRHRGNLDPEIASLVKRFNINSILDVY